MLKQKKWVTKHLYDYHNWSMTIDFFKFSFLFFPNCTSAHEVKSSCCLFERLSKGKKNGAFLLGISFFFLEIITFVYYANEKSDDVIGGSTKAAQHSIQNISRNIGAVLFTLGTRNIHHKRNRMTINMLLSWQHSLLQFLSVKTKISPFAIFWSGTEGLARHTNGSHIVLTIPIRLLWVDDPCLG